MVEGRNRILRVIGGHQISGARATLLDVQRAIVQSRLFYSWGIISSATPAAIRPLGPAHVAGIRNASGAFRSSPCKSIYAEAGQLPFEYAATAAIVAKAARLEAGGTIGPQHPLSERARIEFQKTTQEHMPEIARKHRIGDRPWHAEKPQIDWDMTAYVRAGDPPQKVTAAFGLVKGKYGVHRQIFTDGSKEDSEDFTGCGIIDGTETIAIRLPGQCSVFSAEAYAILKALERLPEKGRETTVVYTDSASVTQAVESGVSHHPWVQAIEEEMKRTGVTLCWIPGHCGIQGNERADEAAKSAKNIETTAAPVPGQDFLSWAKGRIRMSWEKEWHGQRELFLRRIKPTTMPGTDREDQEEQRALTRLRIGHTRVTHEGLFRGERATCDVCGVALTVEHILCSCKKYDNDRDNTVCSSSLYEVLNNDAEAERNLIIYLRRTGLLKQI